MLLTDKLQAMNLILILAAAFEVSPEENELRDAVHALLATISEDRSVPKDLQERIADFSERIIPTKREDAPDREPVHPSDTPEGQ